ncbi:acyl-n-acyltransferase [Fusarium sporotrichioides]|uniref:Acyl-n-acyltransferase n=1 Tax=Fusarium sporotrichioides TaxID=5514 RepID=A0A395RYT4_FUSSP|nr:acyl-n-acyltransferase [Fusarium sporotrichioides]
MGGGPITPASRILSNKPFNLRRATVNDLDDITWIVTNSLPDDPGTDYRFPYRDKYPGDFWKWTREEYAEYFERPDKFYVIVVTATVEDEGEERQQPISVGVWDLIVTSDFAPSDHGLNERRDANTEHMKVYTSTIQREFKRYFVPIGREQVPLWALYTHPDFRRRGAASMICEWGRKQAVSSNRHLTLCATPMGKLLYLALGYESLGKIVVQVEGEEERVEQDAMVKYNK